MALEIIHTERAYIVVDNEQGCWSAQWIYNSYLNARKFALAWKTAAKLWRWRCHWRLGWYLKLRGRDIATYRRPPDESQD